MIDLVPTRIYAKLFSAPYLTRKRFRINNFAKLLDFLCWEKREKVACGVGISRLFFLFVITNPIIRIREFNFWAFLSDYLVNFPEFSPS